jgi:hypothetical protein
MHGETLKSYLIIWRCSTKAETRNSPCSSVQFETSIAGRYVIVSATLRKAIPSHAWTEPLGFRWLTLPEYLDNPHMKVVRLSPPILLSPLPQEITLVLVFVESLFDPSPMVQQEGISQWRIPVTPSWIESTAYWVLEQWLNQPHHRVSCLTLVSMETRLQFEAVVDMPYSKGYPLRGHFLLKKCFRWNRFDRA